MRSIRRYVISLSAVMMVTAALGSTVFLMGLKPRLGLDLQGGLSVVLTAPDKTPGEILDKTVEIIRNRVDSAGVAEPEISREGGQNILVQLPGTKDTSRLLKLIGRTAQLRFRPIMEVVPPPVSDDPKDKQHYDELKVERDLDPTKEVVVFGTGQEAKMKFKLGRAALTGGDVRDANARLNTQSGANWDVEHRFTRDGGRRWAQFTGELACMPAGDPKRQIAIVLDDRVETHPEVATDVKCKEGITGGTSQITGDFSEREAKDLALVLRTGALPITLERSQVTTISPTLGRDSLRAGLGAGALGLGLVALYVLLYYRALGLQTWLGLGVFGFIIYCLVTLLGSTIGWSLTLSGIAGLIVSIGIAADSYIVFFERVKDEVQSGKSLRSAMDRGFGQAFRTIVAANTVSVLAALILYLLAVGAVRGFALTLGMATALDVVIFATLTWPVSALLARSRFFSDNRFLGMRRALEGPSEGSGRARSIARKIYRSEFTFDFIGNRGRWFVVSAILLIVSLVALVFIGPKFGIDFKGGTVLRAPAAKSVSVDDVRKAMSEAGQPGAVVQIATQQGGEKRVVQVQTPFLKTETAVERVSSALAKTLDVDVSEVAREEVGPKWGRQISTKALRALGVFLVVVVLYMWARLELKMAIAGTVALLHDLLITAGVYALVGFEVTPATIVAILTILGYSLYDTVVVFDKVRENSGSGAASSRRTFSQVVNDSMNQVLMRSLNTSLTTLIPVSSLLFVGSTLLGAGTLKDLALALLIGIAASTYSSIFVASPLLALLKEREPRYVALRTRLLNESARPQAAGAMAAANPGVGERLIGGSQQLKDALPKGKRAARRKHRRGAVQMGKSLRKKRKR